LFSSIQQQRRGALDTGGGRLPTTNRINWQSQPGNAFSGGFLSSLAMLAKNRMLREDSVAKTLITF
jgi:hypothetical protein